MDTFITSMKSGVINASMATDPTVVQLTEDKRGQDPVRHVHDCRHETDSQWSISVNFF